MEQGGLGGRGYLCKAGAAGDAIKEQSIHNDLEDANQLGIGLQLIPVQHAPPPAHTPPYPSDQTSLKSLQLIITCYTVGASCFTMLSITRFFAACWSK